ncbi:hypothetical protein [Limisalsivibrio acetivorans]|uniref:hypothetical protein n=1 Tax=Limisalsivibrio acetivorans TaxID=1304888 RepID=UPI0003B6985E|nr:hypothetical protein [Limisalsivibrio acetivorans]
MAVERLNAPANVSANADKLFKGTSYDIRAYVGEPGRFFGDDAVLTPEAVRIAGRLMGGMTFKLKNGSELTLREGDTVVIGYDNGPTSEPLANAFAEGLSESGVNVYLIGISGSGQVYQNQTQLGAQGHVQITRSHVEVTTNGAKFGIGSQGIHTYLLKQMNEALKNDIELPVPSQKGEITDLTDKGLDEYADKMTSRYSGYFKNKDNSKIAVNLFGGTGSKYPELFRSVFGDDVTILGEGLDVNSGGLLADPTRKEMVAKVPGFQDALDAGKRIHSFDLDADRGSVTQGADALETGKTGHYLGDALAYILAEYKLRRAVPLLVNNLKCAGVAEEKLNEIERIAKTVYIDARYTSGVKRFVEELGGSTVFHAKGHSLWKETITANMAKMAELAGYDSIGAFAEGTGYRDLQIEASLHLFATDSEDGFPRDDAVENIFILEQIFAEMGHDDLARFFEAVPSRFTTKEIRTPSNSNEAKEGVTADVVNVIRETFGGMDGVDMVEFEGQIRIDWPAGFLMYGMSNTSPKLTFMVEGSTETLRNSALHFMLGLHNLYKAKHGDDAPMDLSENDFFIKESGYQTPEPDKVTLNDGMAGDFLAEFGLDVEELPL